MSQSLSPVSRSVLALLTTLACAGAGLSLWLGLGISLLLARGSTVTHLLPWQRPMLLVTVILIALSLPVFWHRHARVSWRIPGSAVALLTIVFIVLLWALLGRDDIAHSRWILFAGAAVCIGCIAIPMCIAPALPIAGRFSSALIPLQLILALLAGGSILFAQLALKWPGHQMATIPIPILTLLAAVASALLLMWWYGHGGLVPPKRHRWRWTVLGLVFLMPLAIAAVTFFRPGLAHLVWPLAALFILGGIFLQNCLLLTETD
ncbi:MAG: hypothetical protein LBV45_02525 [Xanthomonadaceae bacterium]|jgi:hypothetical protein|nr:hypothetical protein [Xanthomonadaceae bacterium]